MRWAAWAAITFTLPASLLSVICLVPNALELADRIFRTPWAPQRPLAMMLLAQVALIISPLGTFAACRRGLCGMDQQGSLTITLAATTFGIALLAYGWVIMLIVGMPS